MYDAIVAASRFGFGAGPSGPAGGRDWLLPQIIRPAVPAGAAGLDPSAAIVVEIEKLRRMRRQFKGTDAAAAAKAAMLPARQRLKRGYLAEIAYRYGAACDSPTPLVERLVAFWSNHFTVSGVRPPVRPLAGPFEREAIRPHVTGRFEDMVLAVVRHPAMGLYLDNAISVGPDSRVGRRRKRGVNENLGRELMELHTLGVDGGYHETDVRALARILTGWSIGGLNADAPGRFRFIEAIHEPGPKILLGKTYPEAGMAQGEAAIRDIARHPATARHIARKLAVHFVSDRPPERAVDYLADVFRGTGGDLAAVTRALVMLPEAWGAFQQKVKTPWDLVVSASIATGHRLPPQFVLASAARLGQPIYMAPQPAGWPDEAAAWVGPEAVLHRVDWCNAFAGRAAAGLDPPALAGRVLGDALDPEAHRAIARAESRRVALALLLASPAFQRR